MKKNLIVLGFIITLLTLSVNTALADGAYGKEEVCVPVYGGGEECPQEGEILIDKKVQNPKTGIYVDNLLPSDLTRYRPREVVSFQLIVKNSGDKTLDTIVVKDTIPSFIDYMSISPDNSASYDPNTRVLTFTARDLTAGAAQVFEMRARVVHVAALPEEKSVICPVNIVSAETEGKIDKDESQFCIEREFEAPKETPEAGPASWIISIFGLGSSMLAGIGLRKKR